MVSNVQILHASPSGEAPPSDVAVRCRFLVYRNRVETETDLLVRKREDTLRRVDGTWKIARRMVVLDQSVLLAKNLTFFI
jgi:3-phenylpropionate/cinnamic acid dioxygenase small subunit